MVLTGKAGDSGWRVVVAGLLPRYHVGSVVLSRMSGMCSRVVGVCRTEEIYHKDL